MQTQKIGRHGVSKNVDLEGGICKGNGRQRPREPVRASSVPRRSLKRTRRESGGMAENVASDPNRRGVCVCGKHGVCRLETQEYSPAMVEGRKEGGLLRRSYGSPSLAGKELWVKVLATMTVPGSTLSVSGRCLLVRNDKERVNTKSKEARE